MDTEIVQYRRDVQEVIEWLSNKEKELHVRPAEESLNDCLFSEILNEYKCHEEYIKQVCEYCQNIMKCKVDGQELRENDALSEEERDEVGIELDAMLVQYEKLKFLATDRLRNIQKLIEEKQQCQIERNEEWLSSIEMKISCLNNIGPDLQSISRQLGEMKDLCLELSQKQDFLNFTSSVIIFDDVDSETLQIKSRSCESLDQRLENMNTRWREICEFVDARRKKLEVARDIWDFVNNAGGQILRWLDAIETLIQEMSETAKSLTDAPSKEKFLTKLLTRSEKFESDLKSEQVIFSGFEIQLRSHIEAFDDPCSMLIIQWERTLEDMQARLNTVLNRKRMLDYTLQALVNPESTDRVVKNMIPLPEPITSNANNGSMLVNATALDPHVGRDSSKTIINDSFNTSSSGGNDSKDSSSHMNASYSDSKVFDDSLSSDSKSLLFGEGFQNKAKQNQSPVDGSQDELSSGSLTVSFPINSNEASKLATRDKDSGFMYHLDETNIQRDLCPGHQSDAAHSCRVEEWRHSLESFTNWLKRVESSLGIDSSIDNIVCFNSDRRSQTWTSLDWHRKLIVLFEIEGQIMSTWQDEFDRLLVQGRQIIEDFIPEISEYEANLQDILSDLGIRYGAVKKCLIERKHEIADKDMWLGLLGSMRKASEFLIAKMDSIMPEANIGVDLIYLAQHQEELMRAKSELQDDIIIHSSMQQAKMFLRLCDIIHEQSRAPSNSVSMEILQQRTKNQNNPVDYDIWASFMELKPQIESQLDRLTIHYSELSQLIDDRSSHILKVQEKMQELQFRMQELATKLQVSEILKSSWPSLCDMSVEQLSEQLEDLKLYRERLDEVEKIHKQMNSILDSMSETNVPLSQQNLKRIDELNSIWNQILLSVEDRQKMIEDAFDSHGNLEQKFLDITLADFPRWERRVATSHVPYFVDRETNKTEWDHPKFTDLFKSMAPTEMVIFAAYRTALKLRMIQKKLTIDLLMLEQLKEIFHQLDMSQLNHTARSSDSSGKQHSVFSNGHDSLVGIEQVILLLKAIYEYIQSEERPSLDVPLSIDLTLNWLLNLYDSTRTGFISIFSLKVGLAMICCATLEEKYIFLFEQVADQRTGEIDTRRLGTLVEACMRVPIYLGEEESFGGPNIVEDNIRKCFSMSKLKSKNQNCIQLADYLNWLRSGPQFIVWLSVLHRIHISEITHHPIKCNLCGANPLIGLRYRCLKCFKFNICQNCFLTGRHIQNHFDPDKHPMQEYCSLTKSGENVRDFTRILRNKIKSKPRSKQTMNVD